MEYRLSPEETRKGGGGPDWGMFDRTSDGRLILNTPSPQLGFPRAHPQNGDRHSASCSGPSLGLPLSTPYLVLHCVLLPLHSKASDSDGFFTVSTLIVLSCLDCKNQRPNWPFSLALLHPALITAAGPVIKIRGRAVPWLSHPRPMVPCRPALHPRPLLTASSPPWGSRPPDSTPPLELAACGSPDLTLPCPLSAHSFPK